MTLNDFLHRYEGIVLKKEWRENWIALWISSYCDLVFI